MTSFHVDNAQSICFGSGIMHSAARPGKKRKVRFTVEASMQLAEATCMDVVGISMVWRKQDTLRHESAEVGK